MWHAGPATKPENKHFCDNGDNFACTLRILSPASRQPSRDQLRRRGPWPSSGEMCDCILRRSETVITQRNMQHNVFIATALLVSLHLSGCRRAAFVPAAGSE